MLNNGDKRMNWNIMDLKVGDYIKCKNESELEEFVNLLSTYGYVVHCGDNLFKYGVYYLKIVARWFDIKNFK